MNVDAVVIGGGVQGASAAYHLATKAGLKVVLVEQYKRPGVASSASAAMLTQQTGHPFTAGLAKRSLAMYRELSDGGWDIGFTVTGYFTYASDEHGAGFITRTSNALATAGITFELLEGDAAARGLSEVTDGYFGKTGAMKAVYSREEGYVDPVRLVGAFLEKAGESVIRIFEPFEAVKILLKDDRIAGVDIKEYGRIGSTWVVNCGGGWAPRIAGQVGLQLPIRCSRRQMARIRLEPTMRLTSIVEHLSRTDGEWYFRPAGDTILVGTGRVRWLRDDEAVPYVAEVEDDLARVIGHYLQRNTIAESFEAITTWAGDRPITFTGDVAGYGDELVEGGTNVENADRLPIVSCHPTVSGYIDSCGWGEFGVTLAPLGGYLVAQLASGEEPIVDMGPLASGRFAMRARQ